MVPSVFVSVLKRLLGIQGMLNRKGAHLLQMRVDVEVLAPFDHTLEDADETLEALGSNPSQLVRRCANLESLSAAGDF